MLALADVGADHEVDAESLFARLSFLVRPKRPGHLEPQEFRVVAKPLGLSAEEADKSFTYLDYYGGNHHAPPATITVQDIAWLNRLPLRRRVDGQFDGLIDLEAVTLTASSERTENEALRHLTWARASSRHSKRGEILRWSIFKDGNVSDNTPRGGRSKSEEPGRRGSNDTAEEDDNYFSDEDNVPPPKKKLVPQAPRSSSHGPAVAAPAPAPERKDSAGSNRSGQAPPSSAQATPAPESQMPVASPGTEITEDGDEEEDDMTF
jgi:hypothetical protein